MDRDSIYCRHARSWGWHNMIDSDMLLACLDH